MEAVRKRPAMYIGSTDGHVAVTGLDSNPNGPGYDYFSIEVPAGATQLDVSTTGGTGELVLYARHGTLPTTWGTLSSTVPGTTRQAIRVFNHFRNIDLDFRYPSRFAGVSLTAEYQ